jgi:hypothetical protein
LTRPLVVGGAFAAMGLTKLAGAPWERRRLRRWGEDDARLPVGLAETGGAILLMSPYTRRLGAAVLATASAPTLSWEMEKGDVELAVIRFALMALAMGTAFGRR